MSPRTQRVRVDGVLSDAVEVLSGVPQGSVLGPLLFIIYIDTLSDGILDGLLSLFADDSRLGQSVICKDDVASLQASLDVIHNWSLNWQLPLSPEKCEVMSFGGVLNETYYLGGSPLENVNKHRDLGITVCEDLSFSTHCALIAAKGHQQAYLLRKCFTHSCAEALVQVFKTYVRPILEYNSAVWSPYLVSDIKKIENVQRRFTKYLPGMRGLLYAERLAALSLESLLFRRRMTNLHICYLLVRGSPYQGDGPPLITCNTELRTRGHRWRFDWRRANLNCRHNFFLLRTGRMWNSLPSFVVEAPNLKSFKSLLMEHSVEDKFKFC